MARTAVTARVDFSGPFFKVDPGKTILENVHKMMEAFAQEGATNAQTRLRVGAAGRAGIAEIGDRVADHVIGRVESRSGRKWTAAAVVQVYNQGLGAGESRSLMAAASYVESRTRAISNVTRQLRGARAVLRANLSKGID